MHEQPWPDETTIPNEPDDYIDPPATPRRRRSAWMVDRDAEAGLLGCILQGADPTIIDNAAWTIPGAQAVHHAAIALHDTKPLDLRIISARVGDELDLLQVTTDGRHVTGAAALVDLVTKAPPVSSAPAYADIVADHHRGRQLAGVIGRVEHALSRHDTAAALDALEHAPTRGPSAMRLLPSITLDEFLATDEPAYDWIIEGVLERTDRVLVTGGEGGGKSTLLRQIAVQAASGIHPFTLDDMPPITVLLLDLENSRKQVRRLIRPLRVSAGTRYDQDRLHITCAPDGLDLLDRDDQAALAKLIDDVRPDLIVGGPVYKLVGGDPTAEEPAKAAATVLDRLRVSHEFALILETHQPHEAGGASKRAERPYGASLWKRWPEFGLHVAATDTKTNIADLRHWRGARDERNWPPALQRGGEWPWTAPADRDLTFARILATARDYAFAHGEMPSLRTVADRLGDEGLTVSKSTVDRIIKSNQKQWDLTSAEAAR